jgi:hypothetical protein
MVVLFVIMFCAILVEYADYLQHKSYWSKWNREKSFIQFVMKGD